MTFPPQPPLLLPHFSQWRGRRGGDSYENGYDAAAAAAHAPHCFDAPPPYVNEEAAVFSQRFPMPPPTIAPMSQVRHKTITLCLKLDNAVRWVLKVVSRLQESCGVKIAIWGKTLSPGLAKALPFPFLSSFHKCLPAAEHAGL